MPQSASDLTCIIPHTYSGFGDRSIGVYGPRAWNSLTSLLQRDISHKQFKLDEASTHKSE